MFDSNKPRYLTRGIDAEIPLELQMFMWEVVDRMPEPKDYMQVFRLAEQNGLQIIHHTAEQPEYELMYILPTMAKAVIAKVYIIDNGDHCIMLLVEEY